MSYFQDYVSIMAADECPFEFLDPGDLTDGVIRLRLIDTLPAEPRKGWAPYYVFHICVVESGDRAGEIHLRIGNTDSMRLYGGNIAYGVRPEHRGQRFAARAVCLVTRLAIRHGLSELWITCNPENLASRRVCEAVGAEFIEIVDLPPHMDMYQEGERQKCRYSLRLDRSTRT